MVVPSPQTVGTSQSREEVEQRREEEGEEGQRLKSNERKEVGEPSMRFSRQEYWSGVPLPSLTLVYNII